MSLFTTTDFGLSVNRYQIRFRPESIVAHPTLTDYLLARSADNRRKLYVSKDFGQSWQEVQSNVMAFFWGKAPYDSQMTIYVQRQEPNGRSVLLRSTNFFRDEEVLMDSIQTFHFLDRYMFVTKLNPSGSSLLHVSRDRGAFRPARFPLQQLRNEEYFIADVTEHLIFVSVLHDDVTSHLYTSDQEGVEFTLVLENVLYVNPARPSVTARWPHLIGEQSFLDLHRVDGMQGVYIASVLPRGKVNIEEVMTKVTFDYGAMWQPIQAPSIDYLGKPVSCSVSENCSLHVSQEFAMLFPFRWNSLIYSQKSAPGIIMASGVRGTSLKGDPRLYVSNSGGATWREALDGDFLYAFGDHGGVMIAVPEGKLTGEAFYSVDEGASWLPVPITRDNSKIMVSGLLTEPGERSTSFFMFGAVPGNVSSWMLVRVDLREALRRECTENDYKMWSPRSELDVNECLLGRKVKFQRRVSNQVCYNGRDYDREIIEERCPCSRVDFGCDIGFATSTDRSSSCTKLPSLTVDFTDPSRLCRPDQLYFNATRGYRRIPGNQCEGGLAVVYEPERRRCPLKEPSDFIVYVADQRVFRYLPVENRSEPLFDGSLLGIAVEFDWYNNCVYVSELVPARIIRQCLNGSRLEIIADRRVAVVEGLAYDWIGGNLFWSDYIKKSIEVARADGSQRRILVNGNATGDIDLIRAIIVNPVTGYLYWSDWSSKTPRIARSWMDGSHITTIVDDKFVKWPNGLAFGTNGSTIFWADSARDCLGRVDLETNRVQLFLEGALPHPFSVGILKEFIYWSDWRFNAILRANKDKPTNYQIIIGGLGIVMNLKAVYAGHQTGSSPCALNNGGCTNLCLKNPTGHTCLCPDELVERVALPTGGERCTCPAGESLADGRCVAELARPCAFGFFKCSRGDICIPNSMRCDGDRDCIDGSDEVGCANQTCLSGDVRCNGTGQCIPATWLCDHDNDCGDFEDEQNCQRLPCNETTFFRCVKDGRCIPRNWRCDNDQDCSDNSDELNCNKANTTTAPNVPGNATKVTCAPRSFVCERSSLCIPSTWRCDGQADCVDGSDEKGCNATCQSWQFQCSSRICIFDSWRCDGESDCDDGSDEWDCSPLTTTPPPAPRTTAAPGVCESDQFACAKGSCIDLEYRCDGVNDCGDGSDEAGCVQPKTNCTSALEFRCTSGLCISIFLRCDGEPDCVDRSDEAGCPPSGRHDSCSEQEFDCGAGERVLRCVFQSWVCDGEADCDNGSDEKDCDARRTCGVNMTRCGSSGECIQLDWICNGRADCFDGSDERGCSTPPPGQLPVCLPDQFLCEKDGYCISTRLLCDGIFHCSDMADELHLLCGGGGYVVKNIDVKDVSSRGFLVTWSTPADLSSQPTVKFAYNVTLNTRPASALSYYPVYGNSFRFQDGRPATQYTVVIEVVLLNGSASQLIPFRGLIPLVTLDEDRPSEPSEVNVTRGADPRAIEITWRRPRLPNGVLLSYRVTVTSNAFRLETSVPATQMFAIIDDLKPARYVITVRAATAGGLSNASAPVEFTLAETGINDRVTQLNVSQDKDTLYVRWTPLSDPAVTGYRVTVEGGFADILERNPSSSDAAVCTFSPMPNGIVYLISIRAVGANGEGPLNSLTFTTRGTRMPNVSPIARHYNDDDHAIELSWNYTTLANGACFGLSLATDERHVHPRSVVMTSLLPSFRITDGIDACQVYVMRVWLFPTCEKEHFVAACSELLQLRTQFHPRAPPKEVAFQQKTDDEDEDPDLIQVNVTWAAACELIDEPVPYLLELKWAEPTGPKTRFFSTPPTSDARLWYQFDLDDGVNYTVRVSAKVGGAMWSQPLQIWLGVPAPSQLIAVSGPNNTATLRWSALHLPHPVYAVWAIDLTLQPDQLPSSSSAPSLLTSDSVATLTNLVVGHRYAFYVAAALPDGKFGQYSNPWTMEYQRGVDGPASYETSGSQVVISKSNALGIALGVCGIVTLLVLALGVIYCRYVRLQRSFLAFTSSHYDHRSGTTTLGHNDELDPADDVPMIQGFADDEPLVVA